MDLDLEADLGIDTVKQAEVFATIREAYGIERDEALKLRDYPTLNHVVGFVRERAPQEAEAGAQPVADETPASSEPAKARSAAPLEAADDERFPRRVPVPVLRPPLDFCVPTGVTLSEGSRVVLMPDAAGASEALDERLKKLDVEVLTIDGAPDVEALEQQLAEWSAGGPIQGVYWLAGLDDEGSLDKLDAQARGDAL